MPCCQVPFHQMVKTSVSRVLGGYGQFVGRHPIPFIVVSIVVMGGLAAGITQLTTENDPRVLYYPRDNRASKEREQLGKIFLPYNHIEYTDFSVVSYAPLEATLIFKVKDSSKSLFDDDVAQEITNSVLNLVDTEHKFNCVLRNNSCVEYGRQFMRDAFRNLVKSGLVTYPKWTDPSGDGSTQDLSDYLADVVVNKSNNVILSARVLQVRYLMLYSSHYYKTLFVSQMRTIQLTYAEMYYETSDSVDDELTKAVEGDTTLFVGAMLLVIAYSCLVTVGGNIVSTRALLAVAGVLATAFGIAGAVGFLSLLGQDFAIINFVVPFLLLGIGVDDMFLVMSSWSETFQQSDMSVPERVGITLTFAGVGMTVTSLTDFLAFMIGYSSVFFSVRSFCLYAGVAVLFVYLSHLTLFTACLSLHGRRVYDSRHFLTCRKVEPRQPEHSFMYKYLCRGEPPRQPRDDESVCERFPRLLIPKLVKLRVVLYSVPVLFAALLAVSLYGAVHIEQGLNFKDLVLRSSYYYDYITTKNEYFPDRIPIGFSIIGEHNYADVNVQQQVKDLLKAAKADGDIQADVEHCWLTAFLNSTFFQNVSLPLELRAFLAQNPVFTADIVVDPNNSSKIVASKCSVLSGSLDKQYDQADLMIRMRAVAENSPLPVIVFQIDFELFEQYLATLPATLQTVGCAVVAIVVVCMLLLPHPFMVALTTLNIIMIICNIFGFMYFWGITLSSITMIHLVMSVGFSVDFSAHVCSAYLMSNFGTRQKRAYDAITHAASPILNGGISSLVGVLLLFTSEAYVFYTFFKIMVLVMIFGIMNSVVFLPVMLTLFGPEQGTASGDEPREQGNGEVPGEVPVPMVKNGPIPERSGSDGNSMRIESITVAGTGSKNGVAPMSGGKTGAFEENSHGKDNPPTKKDNVSVGSRSSNKISGSLV
ncbi:patched domain-containing protein 3-like isoform X2 [Littorina saxatilis]|uniref:SSD domain-containing protein n=2 Tax=Littorina saxatilis TaxID=31220 RepID=A0AAN9BA87_9CAEN